MRKLPYFCFVTLVCVSCKVGEDYTAPEIYGDATLARTLHIDKQTPVARKWYNDFNDSQLTALIERGLAGSADIKTATARLKQARAQLQISRAQLLPQINAQGGYNYEKTSNNIGPAADSHYYNIGFDASWEIDLWGKNRRQTEAKQATLRVAEYTLENVRLTVAAEIAADYINLLQNAENLRLAEQNARLQQEIFATVKAKYGSGLSDESAYDEARYLLENTRAQIPEYRAGVEQYRNALATVIGVLPTELNINTTASKQLSSAAWAKRQNLFDFPAAMLRNRPDVAAAEQKLIAENALVGAAVAELYPDVSISGLWGYAAQGGSKLIRPSSETYSYAPLISLPLLDWNRLQNNVRLQKYIREEAFEDYKQTVLSAVAEIRDAQTAYYEALQSAKNRLAALENMRSVLKLKQQKYSNGLIEFSDIVTAEQNLISAEQAYIASKAQILLQQIAFYKAIGAPL